jgi:hypothetical protein
MFAGTLLRRKSGPIHEEDDMRGEASRTALLRDKDFISGLLFVACGALFLYLAQNYDFGTARRMGPSYFPALLSMALIAIGVAVLARPVFGEREGASGFAWKGLALVVAGTCLFGILIRGAGIVAAIGILVLVSALADRNFRWLPSLALAGALAVFCTVIFVLALGLPIPIVGPWLRL